MRNLYANITLKGPAQEEVVDYLKRLGRRAIVSPTLQGTTVVFDEECDSRDILILGSLSSDLSRDFDCPVLAVLNFNDDILWYELYYSGRLIDQYNSTPDYFKVVPADPISGDAGKLCSAFTDGNGCGDKLETILRKPYDTAVERHLEIINTLDLSYLAAGNGYTRLSQMERDNLPGIEGSVSIQE